MWISIFLMVSLWVYVITRDVISKKKRTKDYLMKKRISGKLDRIESKVDTQSHLFRQLLGILEKKEEEG